MRPFVAQHEFLWDRAGRALPTDSRVYEIFARDNLPKLIGGIQWTIGDVHAAPDAPFYIDGHWSRGARVVDAEGSFARGDETNTVTIHDFWKEQKLGNIDLIDVRLAPGVTVARLDESPAKAVPPTESQDSIRWLKSDYQHSFETARLLLNGVDR